MRKLSSRANQAKNVCLTIAKRYGISSSFLMCTNQNNMHRSCYSGLMYTSFTNQEINYFRELRRSGVKTWLHTIGEEDDISAEKVLAHPSDSHIDILSKWGLLHDEVDILEHVTICGSSFRGNQTQVLLHVDAARRQHFGILNLII